MLGYLHYMLLFMIDYVLILLIGMLAVFLLTGLVGMFSMGQAAFMALGGYSAAMLSRFIAAPIWVTAPVAVAVGALFGLLLGLPAVKLRRDYIAIITLGFGEAVVAFLNNASSLTGGALGLSGISKQTTPVGIVICVVIIVAMIANLKHTRFGRQCMAIKSDELAAAALGIHVARIKLMIFTLAGGISAFAGALWVHTTTYIDPAAFGFVQSSMWIIMVFFGGINSLTGSIFAGIFLGMLPEVLRFSNELRIAIYCGIVLLIINFRPQGLFGTVEWNTATIVRTFRTIRSAILRLASRQPEVR
jgi:branched-chain amino acid transport system permease protein